MAQESGWQRHPLAVAVLSAVLGGFATVVAAVIANQTNTITIVSGPTPTVTATTTATTTATATVTSTITIAPTSGTSVPPTGSAYTLQPLVPVFRLGAPDTSCQRTFADLDLPAARVNGERRDGDDLMYWHCSPIGFQRENAQYLGSAPKTRPATAEQCAQLARVGGTAGSIEPDDLRLDQSFCVVTDEENVAWLRLVKMERNSSGKDPNLVFQLALWKR